MTTAQLILVSVTSALVAVGAMLIVATVKRARTKETPDAREEESSDESSEGITAPGGAVPEKKESGAEEGPASS